MASNASAPLTRLTRWMGGVSGEVVAVENWWEAANIAVVTHLVGCLLDGAEPNVSLAEARHGLEVGLAGYRSANEGRRVTIESRRDRRGDVAGRGTIP